MLRLEDIIIDPEFRDFMPSREDDSRLEAEIELHGWAAEEITVWQHHGILLDGHRRLAIYKRQVERGDDVDGPPIRELKFATREAAFHWIVNFAEARRNLTPEEQKYLLGRKYTAEKNVKGGNENVAAGKAKPKAQNELSVSGERVLNPTAQKIADEAGVSSVNVRRAEKYADAIDTLDKSGVVSKSDILSGKVKVPAKTVVEASKAESPEAARSILDRKRTVNTTPPAEPYSPDTDRKKAVANKNYTRLCTLFGQVEGISDSIEIINVDAAMALLKSDDANAWIEAVVRTTKSLRTLSERLKQEVARVTASEAQV